MRLLQFAAILPLALGAPIRAQNTNQTSLKNLALKTMVSETDIKYTNGYYSTFIMDRGNSENVGPDSKKDTDKLEFPIPDGKLSVFTASGRLVGNVLPTSAGYNLDFASNWLAHPDEILPDVRNSPTNGILKRGAGFANVIARMKPNIGFWVNLSKTLAKFFNIRRTKHKSRRENPNEFDFLEPVFVQGPGVNFASVLALGEITYKGDAFQLVGRGTLFLDVDNVIDYQNCALCNLPTSS